MEILRYRQKMLTTLYSTSGYAPRGKTLFLKSRNVKKNLWESTLLRRTQLVQRIAISFGTKTQTHKQTDILLLKYKDDIRTSFLFVSWLWTAGLYFVLWRTTPTFSSASSGGEAWTGSTRVQRQDRMLGLGYTGRFLSGILRDKTMAVNLMYIPNDDTRVGNPPNFWTQNPNPQFKLRNRIVNFYGFCYTWKKFT